MKKQLYFMAIMKTSRTGVEQRFDSFFMSTPPKSPDDCRAIADEVFALIPHKKSDALTLMAFNKV